jgi:hypothetical protein
VVFSAAYKLVGDLVRFVELETSVTGQIKIIGLGAWLGSWFASTSASPSCPWGDHNAGAPASNFLPNTLARLTIAAKRHTVLFGVRRDEHSNQTAGERLSRLHLQQLPFFPSACQLTSATRWKKEVGEEVFNLLTDPEVSILVTKPIE